MKRKFKSNDKVKLLSSSGANQITFIVLWYSTILKRYAITDPNNQKEDFICYYFENELVLAGELKSDL